MPSNIGATEHHQFYGHGVGAAAVAVDLSGNANCTAGATHVYQSAFGYGADCTAMVAIDLESGVTPAGYIFSRYGGGQTLQGVRYNGTTGLQLVVGNAVVHTITIPSDGEIVVSWSMTADPLDAAAVRSEVRAWDADTGDFADGISWSHAEPAGLAAADIIWGAQVTAGTNGTAGTLQGAGFLLHGTGSVQVHRDRVSAAAAPALTGDTAMEVPMPSWSSNLGAQGRLAGPTHYVAAGSVVANHLLLASPLVNVQWDSPTAVSWSTVAFSAWWTPSPDGDSYLGLPLLWRRPVPQTVNEARCRVYVSGAYSGGSSSTLSIRVWSANRNPGADSPVALESYATVAQTIDSVDFDATGQWLDCGDLRLSRTASGERSWLAVSVEITGGGAGETSFAVHAVTIDPISVTETGAIGEVGNG